MRRVAEASLALSASPAGFTPSDLAVQIHSMTGQPEALRSLTALLVLREKIIRLVLAAGGQPATATIPAHPTPVDHYYESIRAGMRCLFTELGIAA